MQAAKRFRFFYVIVTYISIVVDCSPLHTNFHIHSSNSHDSRYEEIENEDVYRLPNNVVPVSYELKIVPDLKNFTFAGQVNITVRIEFPTDRIILHSKNLAISENITITEKGCCDNATIIPAIPNPDEKNEILILKTDEKFKYGQNYSVSIKFQGDLEEKASPAGFYRTSYRIDNQTRWLATTYFEPTHARRAFPCFDEPRFKTPFTVYLAHSDNHIAISNMPSETTTLLPADSMSNGQGYVKFEQTPPIPTYLVAFMVSDFKMLEDKKIRVITKPNSIQNGSYALNQANKLLKYFEEYFGISYPSSKLDVVAVPGFQGGMENWGMTTYAENHVILQDDHSQEEKIDITKSISHEFSHLWFGDMVTPTWYDFLWLKEGFATYFEYFATAAIEPTWNREEIFVFKKISDTFSVEIFHQHAITWPIRKMKDIESLFTPRSARKICYDKGAILIRMFELTFSPKTFQSALCRYLMDGQKYQHGVTSQKNLFDAFDTQVELDSVSHLPPNVFASDVMKTWTGNMGYPLITISRSYEQREVNITQIPYPLPCPTSNIQYQDQKWIIPLTFTTKAQSQFSNLEPKHWSIGNEPVKLIGFDESDWVLFNLKRSGYYRVNYDTKNWQLLIDQLIENYTKIHVLNRVQLIDDVFTLTEDRLINCTIAGRLIEYLQNETNIMPWYTATLWLKKVIHNKRSSESQKNLKNHLKTIVENSLGSIICDTSTDINGLEKEKYLLRILSKLLNVSVSHCMKNVSEIYQKNYNDFNKIPRRLKSTVFCDILLYSDDVRKSFDYLWHNYQRSKQIYEKKRILTSIFSCADNEEIIKSVLSKIIDSRNGEISQQDLSFILNEFPSEIPAVTATIKFIDERILNFDASSIEFLRRLLDSIDSKIQTEEQVELVKNLETKFESLKRKEYVEFAKMVETLRVNAVNRITYDKKLEDWFPSTCLSLNGITET